MRTVPVRKKAFSLLTYIFEHPLRRCRQPVFYFDQPKEYIYTGGWLYICCPFSIKKNKKEKCAVLGYSIKRMIRNKIICPIIEEGNG